MTESKTAPQLKTLVARALAERGFSIPESDLVITGGSDRWDVALGRHGKPSNIQALSAAAEIARRLNVKYSLKGQPG